jgi:hypothetical protein
MINVKEDVQAFNLDLQTQNIERIQLPTGVIH